MPVLALVKSVLIHCVMEELCRTHITALQYSRSHVKAELEKNMGIFPVQGDFSQLLDKKMADFSEKLIDFEFESIPV